MDEYAAASSFGWLDFDSAASERVSTLLRALEQPGTLDPLGFSVIRDPISGMLAPGTSTIQTRLRYFMFLPWIFQGIDRDRVAPSRFARRLRDDEAKLIECLRHLGPSHGVQGYSAGRNLQRMPSEAYWSGLLSWGIRRVDVSIADYGRRLGAMGRLSTQRDDDGNPTERAVQTWASIPDPPDRFLSEEIAFDLTQAEATLIIDQIRRHHPSSLLASGCRNPAATAQARMPWDIDRSLLSGELQSVIRHARAASELTIGPQLLYNLLLAERARAELGWDTSELRDDVHAQLDDWAVLVENRHIGLQSWASDIGEFWAILDARAPVNKWSRDFITEIIVRAAQDPRGFVRDKVVHQLIRDREIRLKSNRARLGPLSALENWNQQPFGGQLVYRWPICRTYLEDLAVALGSAG